MSSITEPPNGIDSCIINYGSINIDHVYKVTHFVQPGETLQSTQLQSGLGGKGANQSVAIARAGGAVMHVGQLSSADSWALKVLDQAGVDTKHIKQVQQASGHAIIQVEAEGENAILLHGGANQSCELSDLEVVIQSAPNAEFLLMQNECNNIAAAFDLALSAGLKIALNPAPMSDAIKALPLEKLSVLIVNEVEATALSGQTGLASVVAYFKRHLSATMVVLTLGSQGAVLLHNGEQTRVAAYQVSALDTTGAGDTFVGYFINALVQGNAAVDALGIASAAAALAVTQAGAIDAIPTRQEVTEFTNA